MISKEIIKQELINYRWTLREVLKGRAPASDYMVLLTCYVLGVVSCLGICAIF